MNETKDKILDTAERLFADQGYAATSLRQVIAEAEVNLAAVHYHFGTKDELLDAVVLRKAEPVNAARLAWLERVEAEAGDGPLAVEQVLEAFLMPTAEKAQRSPEFVRLMGRIMAEDLMPSLVEKHFQGTAMRFVGALRKAVPDLAHEELIWRVNFMLGAMARTISQQPVLHGMKGDAPDMPQRMRRLVTFLSAGFRAAATPAVKEK